jgi:hypothetical protein
MIEARVWSSSRTAPPGRLTEVALPVVAVGPRSIRLPGVTVCDVGPERLFTSDELRFDPRDGGGPLCSSEHRREARGFGVVNVAFHLRRGLDRISALLGHALPPLVARIGVHASQAPRWGGGHYRLPALTYQKLPEEDPPLPTGEIHLGLGGGFIPLGGSAYFHAPSHNAGIVCHELGHHLTRHTADLRLNSGRPPGSQANRKVALDEGTCDYLAAVLLETPDIFGWHRHRVPATSLQRRRLDGPWTMAAYGGRRTDDPHSDGAIWASALWAARSRLEQCGVAGEEFDRLVLRTLARIGRSPADGPRAEALQRRMEFGGALAALLDEDPSPAGRVGGVVEAVFASRGIEVGYDNDELQQRARARMPQPIGGGR